MTEINTKLRKLIARVLAKWSEKLPVSGILVVKRKITASLAVIFLKMSCVDKKDAASKPSRRNGFRVCSFLALRFLQKWGKQSESLTMSHKTAADKHRLAYMIL